MAKLPPIDLTGLLKLLRQEGRGELHAACAGSSGGSKILKHWDDIIISLEQIIPELAKGADINKIKGPIQTLAKSAASLGYLASQILSFVPGPIGIVCSAINAIVCFCTLPFPINIGNGMLELLGCIPGGKVAAKGGAKLAPKIEKLLLKTIEDSPQLRSIIKQCNEIASAVKRFASKATKQADNVVVKPTAKPATSQVGHYNQASTRTAHNLEETMRTSASRTGTIKAGTPYPSTNYMEYILSTKTGKYAPYSHLYP